MLVLARRTGEALLIDCGGVRIRVLVADIRIGGRSRVNGQARIAIDAPQEVHVLREELGPVFHSKEEKPC